MITKTFEWKMPPTEITVESNVFEGFTLADAGVALEPMRLAGVSRLDHCRILREPDGTIRITGDVPETR